MMTHERGLDLLPAVQLLSMRTRTSSLNHNSLTTQPGEGESNARTYPGAAAAKRPSTGDSNPSEGSSRHTMMMTHGRGLGLLPAVQLRWFVTFRATRKRARFRAILRAFAGCGS